MKVEGEFTVKFEQEIPDTANPVEVAYVVEHLIKENPEIYARLGAIKEIGYIYVDGRIQKQPLGL